MSDNTRYTQSSSYKDNNQVGSYLQQSNDPSSYMIDVPPPSMVSHIAAMSLDHVPYGSSHLTMPGDNMIQKTRDLPSEFGNHPQHHGHPSSVNAGYQQKGHYISPSASRWQQPQQTSSHTKGYDDYSHQSVGQMYPKQQSQSQPQQQQPQQQPRAGYTYDSMAMGGSANNPSIMGDDPALKVSHATMQLRELMRGFLLSSYTVIVLPSISQIYTFDSLLSVREVLTALVQNNVTSGLILTRPNLLSPTVSDQEFQRMTAPDIPMDDYIHYLLTLTTTSVKIIGAPQITKPRDQSAAGAATMQDEKATDDQTVAQSQSHSLIDAPIPTISVLSITDYLRVLSAAFEMKKMVLLTLYWSKHQQSTSMQEDMDGEEGDQQSDSTLTTTAAEQTSPPITITAEMANDPDALDYVYEHMTMSHDILQYPVRGWVNFLSTVNNLPPRKAVSIGSNSTLLQTVTLMVRHHLHRVLIHTSLKQDSKDQKEKEKEKDGESGGPKGKENRSTQQQPQTQQMGSDSQENTTTPEKAASSSKNTTQTTSKQVEQNICGVVSHDLILARFLAFAYARYHSTHTQQQQQQQQQQSDSHGTPPPPSTPTAAHGTGAGPIAPEFNLNSTRVNPECPMCVPVHGLLPTLPLSICVCVHHRLIDIFNVMLAYKVHSLCVFGPSPLDFPHHMVPPLLAGGQTEEDQAAIHPHLDRSSSDPHADASLAAQTPRNAHAPSSIASTSPPTGTPSLSAATSSDHDPFGAPRVQQFHPNEIPLNHELVLPCKYCIPVSSTLGGAPPQGGPSSSKIIPVFRGTFNHLHIQQLLAINVNPLVPFAQVVERFFPPTPPVISNSHISSVAPSQSTLHDVCEAVYVNRFHEIAIYSDTHHQFYRLSVLRLFAFGLQINNNNPAASTKITGKT